MPKSTGVARPAGKETAAKARPSPEADRNSTQEARGGGGGAPGTVVASAQADLAAAPRFLEHRGALVLSLAVEEPNVGKLLEANPHAAGLAMISGGYHITLIGVSLVFACP